MVDLLVKESRIHTAGWSRPSWTEGWQWTYIVMCICIYLTYIYIFQICFPFLEEEEGREKHREREGECWQVTYAQRCWHSHSHQFYTINPYFIKIDESGTLVLRSSALERSSSVLEVHKMTHWSFGRMWVKFVHMWNRYPCLRIFCEKWTHV